MNDKFRIWDEKYNCWSKESILCYPGEELKKQGRVIQWYTGVKDKGGKEICEGDIVKWGDLNYIVEWNHTACKWQGRSPEDHGHLHLITEYFIHLRSGEIVGNLFEHPCKMDHNGECLVCDESQDGCKFKK
jgi:hypothetical protein